MKSNITMAFLQQAYQGPRDSSDERRPTEAGVLSAAVPVGRRGRSLGRGRQLQQQGPGGAAGEGHGALELRLPERDPSRGPVGVGEGGRDPATTGGHRASGGAAGVGRGGLRGRRRRQQPQDPGCLVRLYLTKLGMRGNHYLLADTVDIPV